VFAEGRRGRYHDGKRIAHGKFVAESHISAHFLF
jgi:hypothetical protein